MPSNGAGKSAKGVEFSAADSASELGASTAALEVSYGDGVNSERCRLPPPSAKGAGKLLLSEFLQWDDAAIRKGFNHQSSPEWRKDALTLDPKDLTFEEIAAIFNPDLCKRYMNDCCWVRYWTKYFALKSS